MVDSLARKIRKYKELLSKNSVSELILPTNKGKLLYYDNQTLSFNVRTPIIQIRATTNDTELRDMTLIPGLEEIFNKWTRFIHSDFDAYVKLKAASYTHPEIYADRSEIVGPGGNHEWAFPTFQIKSTDPNASTYSAWLNDWTYDSSNNALIKNTDCAPLTGFLSNDEIDNWYFHIQDTTWDEDSAVLIVAYMEDSNGVGHTLSLHRAKWIANYHTEEGYQMYTNSWGQSVPPWALIYDIGNPSQDILINKEDYFINRFGNTTMETGYRATNTTTNGGPDSVFWSFNEHIACRRNKNTIIGYTNVADQGEEFVDGVTITYTLPSIKPDNMSQEEYNNIKYMLSNPCKMGLATIGMPGTFYIKESYGCINPEEVADLTNDVFYQYNFTTNSYVKVGKISEFVPNDTLLYNNKLNKLYYYYIDDGISQYQEIPLLKYIRLDTDTSPITLRQGESISLPYTTVGSSPTVTASSNELITTPSISNNQLIIDTLSSKYGNDTVKIVASANGFTPLIRNIQVKVIQIVLSLSNNSINIDGNINKTFDLVVSTNGDDITYSLDNTKYCTISELSTSSNDGITKTYRITELLNGVSNITFNSLVNNKIITSSNANVITTNSDPIIETMNTSMVQDSSTTVFLSDLLPSQYSNYSYNSVTDVINGSTNVESNAVTFSSAAKTGSNAGFSVVYKDANNNRYIKKVQVNITRLPDINSYFFDTADDINLWQTVYVPPTLANVFKSWNRFSDNTSYYPSGTTPAGEATKWEMISSNQFRCTINSSHATGFISPDKYKNYVHEATVSSTDGDDDTIGIVIAYRQDPSTKNNQVLAAIRTVGGMSPQKGWGLAYINGSQETIIKTIDSIFGLNSDYYSSNNGYGWNKAGQSRIYVSRVGNIITVKCSDFKSTTYNNNSFIQINVSDYPELSWIKDTELPYGYMCWSQNYSSFNDVNLEGGTDPKTSFCVADGKLYEYNETSGQWEVSTGTIQDKYGYPRYVVNPDTNSKYEILENSVSKIE